jgi:hypothetical protein
MNVARATHRKAPGSTVPEPVSGTMPGMALRGVRGTANKGGRPSKGDRRARTIRFPAETDAVLEQGADVAGYTSVNDYVVDLVSRALEAGLIPVADVQEHLPLSA